MLKQYVTTLSVHRYAKIVCLDAVLKYMLFLIYLKKQNLPYTPVAYFSFYLQWGVADD